MNNSEIKEKFETVKTVVETEGKKPVTLKIWVVAAIAVGSFILGALVF